MILKNYSNEQLWNETKVKVREEAKAMLEVLHYLREIEDRKLYLARGYGSLLDCCVKEFGYSEASAFRRIDAMRLLKELPQLETRIESGELNLTKINLAQQLFRAEERENKPITPEQKFEFLDSLQGLTTRQVQNEVVSHNPNVAPKEKIKQVSAEQVHVDAIIPIELQRKLEKIKQLRSHVNPSPTFAEQLDDMANLVLKQLEPKAVIPKVSHETSTEEQVPENLSTKSRYPTRKMRRIVMAKDASCDFEDPETGRRCGSKHMLEVDHMIPWSIVKKTELWNLRVLCRAHNQWGWKRPH